MYLSSQHLLLKCYDTWLHHYVLMIGFMFIVLMTTAHEESRGGQDGGSVDKVTQQTLSK